ncbi:MAG: tetratricopeptide repeat protein [Ignavibacteriaceae bacterium]|nr:tetratricopeptide repeat protein [Ignavibacteriaceae bacterium]
MNKTRSAIISAMFSLFILLCLIGCSTTPKDAGKIPITTSSDDAKQNFITGRDLTEKLRGQESLQYFDKAIAADSNFAQAYLIRSAFQPTAKDFFDDLNKAVSLSANVSQGEQLMISGFEAGINANPVKQQADYEKLVSLYPKDERAQNLLANSYFGTFQDQKAIDGYKKAIEINPDFSGSYNSLGYAYRRVGNYSESEKAFQKYIELIPNDPNPYDSYAELLLKEGKYDAAIENYQKALSKDAGFTSSKVGIAAAQMYKGNYDEARKELQQLFDSARNDGEKRTALFNMAVTYADEGKPDMALKELDQEYAIAEKANDYGNMSGDLNAMGVILYESGKYAEALDKFRKSVDAFDKSSSSQALKDNVKLGLIYNEGQIAMKQNDLKTASEKAEQFMSGVKAINNANQIMLAHELMGTIALEQKKYDDCLTHLNQANQQNPYNFYYTARAYELKGDKQKAKEYYDKVMNFNVLPNINTAFARSNAKKMLKES